MSFSLLLQNVNSFITILSLVVRKYLIHKDNYLSIINTK